MGCTRRQFVHCALTGIGAFAGSWVGACSNKDELDHEAPSVRWAMVVDLRKCESHTGCKACVAACHGAHNVPDFGDASRHRIEWIRKASFDGAFPSFANHPVPDRVRTRPVVALCNHCDNPPCVRVCPARATWRGADGIVRMDWHRCIGCRYCAVACPYGSRSFNWVDPKSRLTKIDSGFPTRTQGVVEKCTLCADRLARNQIPMCVEACFHGALVFGNVRDPDSTVSRMLQNHLTIRRKANLGTEPHVFYLV